MSGNADVSDQRPAKSITGWACLQLALGGILLAVIAVRAYQLTRHQQLPALRDSPLVVMPEYDYPVVVSDEQLPRVLQKLVPRDYGAETRVNHVDHALRFWGVQAKFDDSRLLSGEAMRQLLIDHSRFAEVYGGEQAPLLMDHAAGVRVRVNEGTTSSSHVDHTMATLAEVGTTLDQVIQTTTGRTTYGDIVRQSLRDFSLNQREYEWSALTYALYVIPHSWVTSEGQRVDFDLIAARIMRQRMPQGVCFGNHRLFTLVMLLRVDQLEARTTPMLSPTRRQEILDYLTEMTGHLVQHQHPDGFWNGDWPTGSPPSSQPSEQDGDRLPDRILATGHALEWWSMAPLEVHPPRHVLASGGQWLVKTIDELSDEQIKDYYTFLTHAGRALALWRSRPPAEVVHRVTLARGRDE